MSSLRFHEKEVFEDLLEMRSGYVLDFTDRTFREFFNDYSIDIDNDNYRMGGNSKAKRLRCFWSIENDEKVYPTLTGLTEHAESLNPNSPKIASAHKILNKFSTNELKENTVENFLDETFDSYDLSKLNLQVDLEGIISQRLMEVKKCLNAESPLSVIFLCGSTLEGLLLSLAQKEVRKFNQSTSSPKKVGKVKPLHDWTLNDLINVSQTEGFISLDVKKFSHSLRDFRNFIHPNEQACRKFTPDMHTAKICWQVLQAAMSDLTGKRTN